MSASLNAACGRLRLEVLTRAERVKIATHSGLGSSWPGSSEYLEAADAVVEQAEEALEAARLHAAVAHANASSHHHEVARPELEVARSQGWWIP